MSQVFNRYEEKYIIDMDTYHRLLERLEGYVYPDQYSQGGKGYAVNNLYLDTDDDWFIRNSLQRPPYKEKLRLRCYGQPDADSLIYYEIKKKICRMVNKRRTSMTLQDAVAFTTTHILPSSDQNSQVLREIAYILHNFSPYPKVALFYDRAAYYSPDDKTLRITFDTNLRARRDKLDFCHGRGGQYIIPPDKVVMEIKVPHSLPLWLARIISEMQIVTQTFSKYGTEYRQYLHQQYLYGEYIPEECCQVTKL